MSRILYSQRRKTTTPIPRRQAYHREHRERKELTEFTEKKILLLKTLPTPQQNIEPQSVQRKKYIFLF